MRNDDIRGDCFGQMKHQHITLICLLLLLAGCGYTILKESVRETGEDHRDDVLPSNESGTTQLSDSLLFGTWVGTGRCLDHASSVDYQCRIVFGSDYSWLLQTTQTTSRGTWNSSTVHGKYQIRVKSEDWMWNGVSNFFIRGDELTLSINRPWQFDCTLILVRSTIGSDEVNHHY